eukprot:gene16677-19819_t
MYRAYSLVSKTTAVRLQAAATNSVQQRLYASGKKSKFTEFEDDDEDMVIDTRLVEKIVEKKRDEQVDIDHMIANTTMRQLKLMRWTEDYEGLDLAKREYVDLHNAFSPDESTEQVLAKIKTRELAELKGSKFTSVKVAFTDVAKIKTTYIADLLNQFKAHYEKPLVELYVSAIGEANDKYRGTRAAKKRALKMKLKEGVAKRLSSLERGFRDLMHVKNAMVAAVKDNSIMDGEQADETWQRMLERSNVLDPLNLARDIIKDDYNDFGNDYEFTEAYVTQLTMVPFDFANPRTYNSLVNFYDDLIDSIDEADVAEPRENYTPAQIKTADEIERLRKLGLDLSPEDLKVYLATQLNAEQDKDLSFGDSPSAVATNVEDTATLEANENVEEVSADQQQKNTTKLKIDKTLRQEFERVTEMLTNKIDTTTIYREPTSVSDAKTIKELMRAARSGLKKEDLAYNEKRFLYIAFPEEVVAEEATEQKAAKPKRDVKAAMDAQMLVLQNQRSELASQNKSTDNIDFKIEELETKMEDYEDYMEDRADEDQELMDEEGDQEEEDDKEDDDEEDDEDDNEDDIEGREDDDEFADDMDNVEDIIDIDNDVETGNNTGTVQQGGAKRQLTPEQNAAVQAKIDAIEAQRDLIPNDTPMQTLPDFELLAADLMERQDQETARIVAKFANSPVNEKTASDVLDDLYASHKENNIFHPKVIEYDAKVLREAHGDVAIPTAVQFQYDTTFKDLVDRDVIFKMPLKDTDLVRVLTHQLSEFGLVKHNKVLKEAPDNVPITREIVESNPDLFPNLLEHVDETREMGYATPATTDSTVNDTSSSTNKNNTTSTTSATTTSTKSNQSNTKATTTTTTTTSTTSTTTTQGATGEFSENDIYHSERLYTELNPIFEDNGVITLPPKEQLRKKVPTQNIDEVVGNSGMTRRQFRSHDAWLMGKPFDLSKYRLGGQENPLPFYRYDTDKNYTEDDDDEIPPPDATYMKDIEMYRYFQEGKGEEWFGPEKVGDQHIDPLNTTMRWYPRNHMPTYPIQFELSHNTQDTHKEDFWASRKVVMRVNIGAMDLPPVVEERLAAITKKRFDAETRILTIVANNHNSQDENKFQCKRTFMLILHEANMADPNFVSMRADEYVPEKALYEFIPSKAAKSLDKFNLFRLTGFPLLQEQRTKQEFLQSLKNTLA